MKRSTPRECEKDRELARRIHAAGIPVFFEAKKDEVPELLIRHDFDAYESIVFNDGARTGLILPLRIVPNIPVFVFSAFEICLPKWTNVWFTPLEENLGNRWPHYQFCGRSELKFSRAEVINHSLTEQKTVHRGHQLRGLLLAFSPEQLPDDLIYSEVLLGSIKIFDQFEQAHCAKISLRVDRQAEREIRLGPQRQRLFVCS